MTRYTAASIAGDGLWHKNPALVRLLGLCPLLAVTDRAVNGLGLGVATTLVMVLSCAVVSSLRQLLRSEIRLPSLILVIAMIVTMVELTMSAFFHELSDKLGIFVSLIVSNCIIIERAETFASRNKVPTAMLDGLATGLGFTAVLFSLGALRELLGQGTILADAQLIFGTGAGWLTVQLVEGSHGFLLAVLPPGAFLGLGLLIALKNLIDTRRERRLRETPDPRARQAATEDQ